MYIFFVIYKFDKLINSIYYFMHLFLILNYLILIFNVSTIYFDLMYLQFIFYI